jgi:hypothetical protein
MDLFAEDLHPRLREVFHDFDNYCKEHGIFYSIVSDEADKQGYLIKKDNLDDLDNLIDWLQGVLERTQAHLDVDRDRKDGALLTFTLESIQDDHWDPMTGHPGAMKGVSKKEDPGQFTIFAKPEDAKSVRAGKTTIQKKGNIKAKDASFEAKLIKALLEDPIEEDQYKSPTGKHRRDQSMFPSSFGPSRTFGGRTDGKKTKKEDFNRKLEWLLNEELDEAEAEALKDLFNLIIQYQEAASGEVEGEHDAIWEELLTTFDEFKNSAMSDEARDISKRFFDAVGSWNPDEKFRSENGQNLHICPEALDEIFDEIVGLRNVRLYGREEGPTVDQEVEMEQGLKPTKPNMRPIGLFGPGDKRQPEGTPPSPGANVAKSIGERVPRNR